MKSRPSARPLGPTPGPPSRETVAASHSYGCRGEGKSTFPELVDTDASTVEVIQGCWAASGSGRKPDLLREGDDRTIAMSSLGGHGLWSYG